MGRAVGLRRCNPPDSSQRVPVCCRAPGFHHRHFYVAFSHYVGLWSSSNAKHGLKNIRIIGNDLSQLRTTNYDVYSGRGDNPKWGSCVSMYGATDEIIIQDNICPYSASSIFLAIDAGLTARDRRPGPLQRRAGRLLRPRRDDLLEDVRGRVRRPGYTGMAGTVRMGRASLRRTSTARRSRSGGPTCSRPRTAPGPTMIRRASISPVLTNRTSIGTGTRGTATNRQPQQALQRIPFCPTPDCYAALSI